jgi:hypothetical protein
VDVLLTGDPEDVRDTFVLETLDDEACHESHGFRHT